MTGPDGPAPGALEGLRVLDLSLWLPGPYLTQMLGDLGADVVKVEPPAGDPGRADSGWVFDVSNRNKRSMAIDLKSEEGRAQLLRMAAHADIFVEGFRPGVVDRLGIGYAAVRTINPAIIYCSISGFGQTGPDRNKPGHDLTYLAITGALSAPPHWVPGPPQRSTAPVADLSSSLFAAVAILASLRDRDRTGVGAYLDVGIADTTLAFASPRAGADFALMPGAKTGIFPQNDIYVAADGEYIAVSAVEEKFWNRLRQEVVPLAPDLGDTAFDTLEGRHREGDRLHAALTAAFLTKPAREWQHLFEGCDVPVDRIVTVAEAVEAPQFKARGIIQTRKGVRSMGFPVLRDGHPMGQMRSPPPRLDQDRMEILKNWNIG